MTLEENTCINNIDLFTSSEIDIIERMLFVDSRKSETDVQDGKVSQRSWLLRC